MSYIPTEWKTGDIVTAKKLNKLEEGAASGGGGGGGLKCLMTIDDSGDSTVYTLDKNYTELTNAINAGVVPIIVDSYGGVAYIAQTEENSGFHVIVFSIIPFPPYVSPLDFQSDSATGVLTHTESL